jgi:hypothetical protein
MYRSRFLVIDTSFMWIDSLPSRYTHRKPPAEWAPAPARTTWRGEQCRRYRDSKSGLSNIQPIASHCTTCPIPTCVTDLQRITNTPYVQSYKCNKPSLLARLTAQTRWIMEEILQNHPVRVQPFAQSGWWRSIAEYKAWSLSNKVNLTIGFPNQPLIIQ